MKTKKNQDGKDIKDIKKIMCLGVIAWCICFGVYISAVFGMIYFGFWCLKHFNIIG